MRWSFPRQVLTALTGSLLLGVYPLVLYSDRHIVASVITGAALSTLNIILGYIAIEYASSKPVTTFTNVVIGAMGIRLALLLGAMLVLVLVAGLHAAALTVSLFYFYSMYLTLEILYIQKRFLKRSSDDPGSRG